MSVIGGDIRVGDSLDSFEEGGCLSHRGDQMRTYAGSDTLALGSIMESVQVCHSNDHVSAWRFVDLLIPDHVESITEVVWRELSFLVCASSGAVGIALLARRSLHRRPVSHR